MFVGTYMGYVVIPLQQIPATTGPNPVAFRKYSPLKNAELQVPSSGYQGPELAALMHVLTSQQKPWCVYMQQLSFHFVALN